MEAFGGDHPSIEVALLCLRGVAWLPQRIEFFSRNICGIYSIALQSMPSIAVAVWKSRMLHAALLLGLLPCVLSAMQQLPACPLSADALTTQCSACRGGGGITNVRDGSILCLCVPFPLRRCTSTFVVLAQQLASLPRFAGGSNNLASYNVLNCTEGAYCSVINVSETPFRFPQSLSHHFLLA